MGCGGELHIYAILPQLIPVQKFNMCNKLLTDFFFRLIKLNIIQAAAKVAPATASTVIVAVKTRLIPTTFCSGIPSYGMPAI